MSRRAPVLLFLLALAVRLPIAGLHLEEIVRTGSGIEGVVVGRVLELSEEPDPALIERYEGVYREFRRLEEALGPLFG